MGKWNEKQTRLCQIRDRLYKITWVLESIADDTKTLEIVSKPSDINKVIYINRELYEVLEGETNIVILSYREKQFDQEVMLEFCKIAEEFKSEDILFALYPADIINDDFWMLRKEATPLIFIVDKEGNTSEIKFSDILKRFEQVLREKLMRQIRALIK